MQLEITNSKQETSSKSLEEILGESDQTLLYFYPKDNTPGCTIEAIDFTKLKDIFTNLGVHIIGVSKDSSKSHCSFMSKQGLEIDLISDSTLELHNKFGAIGIKKMYGKEYEGTIRSSFLLHKKGEIIKERRDVKALGHAQEIINYLKAN